MVVYFTR